MSSKSQKRGPGQVDQAKVAARHAKIKKQDHREFVTPDLLDESGKFNFS